MLNHIGQTEVAEKVQNAWLKTLEDGIHTYDIYNENTSRKKVTTSEFTAAVIQNIGKTPSTFSPVNYAKNTSLNLVKYQRKAPAKKVLEGVDIFVHATIFDPNELAVTIKKLEQPTIKLSMITNRGIKVWPEGFPETFCTDHWRCRFKPVGGKTISKSEIITLLQAAIDSNIDVIKTENLYSFDGKQSYSLGQGQ
jgi:isocitrate dehydrogenase